MDHYKDKKMAILTEKLMEKYFHALKVLCNLMVTSAKWMISVTGVKVLCSVCVIQAILKHLKVLLCQVLVTAVKA